MPLDEEKIYFFIFKLIYSAFHKIQYVNDDQSDQY